MKLSNTLLIDSKLLPSYNKAFTLAEVLITLSILGVVAALTIPSLVNRQSEVAAKSRIKKAIANYEQVTAVYMAENSKSDATGMVAAGELQKYFKGIDVTPAVGTKFTTADGVYWQFDANGYASACDSVSPKYCVQMWVKEGAANFGTVAAANLVAVPAGCAEPNCHSFSSTADFLKAY